MFKLSNQAIGSLMLAVNKGMYAASKGLPKEECNIPEMLRGFSLENTVDGLVVMNPPIIEMTDDFFDKEDDVDSKD